jgi:cation diffusion facilitator CzcD-associated flavoprotein CzcO
MKGIQCDTESYIYMPLLEELGYIPTEKYAHCLEILKHVDMIAQKWDLTPKALFQTEVKIMDWDDKASKWTVRTNRGDKIRSTFIVTANGILHKLKLPGVPGIESFKGETFHTSRWDYDITGGDSIGNLTKLADKTIGIIGTGATAVQLLPQLSRYAKRVYVFQRTPSSINVRNNRPTSSDPKFFNSLKPGWQLHRQDNFNTILGGGAEEEDLVSDGWDQHRISRNPKRRK